MELKEINIDENVGIMGELLINRENRAREALKKNLGKKLLISDWHKGKIICTIRGTDDSMSYE